MKWVVCLIAISWTIPTVIAVFPLLPFVEDYFVDSIWVSNNPFAATITKHELVEINEWLLTTAKYSNYPTESLPTDSWSTLEKSFIRIIPEFEIKQKFGYYSTHSICLPTLLPDRNNDTAWAYAMLIIILNFLFFFFILVANIILYRTSTKKNKVISDKERKKESEVCNEKSLLLW
uniref:uncharacterized protein LOC120326557 n=1 Tax=Styela clava TaxID=7725 RepID=UPI00193AA850|nr:uncharacterized protein LOC120326557 [Styela clava]